MPEYIAELYQFSGDSRRFGFSDGNMIFLVVVSGNRKGKLFGFISDPGEIAEIAGFAVRAAGSISTRDCCRWNVQCAFTSLKMPKMKSVTSLVVMQNKDLTRKFMIVFYVIFPIDPLKSLNVFGRVI
jgi:hypothetical protein